MDVNAPRIPASTATRTVFELNMLESLPCGCVAAVYDAKPWAGSLVTIEAKGPHCLSFEHVGGKLMGYGSAAELLGYADRLEDDRDGGY